MRYLTTMVLIMLIFGSPATAQSDQTEWLFQCQLNNGANSLGVHVFSDAITYSYANARGQLELNLKDTVADVEHVLSLWEDPNFVESVTFYNGDTSYEVFSQPSTSRPPGDRHVLLGGMVDGGVVVTSPSGSRTEILCDPGTVEPTKPLHRLSRLAALKDPNYNILAACFAADITAEDCVQYTLEYCLTAVSSDIDELECLGATASRVDEFLDDVLVETLTASSKLGIDSQPLERAQDIWKTSREADCAVSSWTVYNPFDDRKGELICQTDYAAKRIEFLTSHRLGLEFDG